MKVYLVHFKIKDYETSDGDWVTCGRVYDKYDSVVLTCSSKKKARIIGKEYLGMKYQGYEGVIRRIDLVEEA